MSSAARGIALAAAVLALVAVVLAAFGAHAIDMREQQESQKIWNTASVIHLTQSAALLGVSALVAMRESRKLVWGGWLLAAGTLVFSGSLYVRVTTGLMAPGITPSGGLMLMAGWGLIVLALLRKP